MTAAWIWTLKYLSNIIYEKCCLIDDLEKTISERDNSNIVLRIERDTAIRSAAGYKAMATRYKRKAEKDNNEY